MKRLLSSLTAVIITFLSVFSAFSSETFKRGDVDLDKEITIIDATAIQKHLCSLLEFNDTQQLLSDTCGDGVVNIIDATLIQKYVAKIIIEFPPEYEDTYVPVYWREHLITKTDQINQTLSFMSEDHCAFFWYSDSHWTYNSGTSPYLLKYLNRHTDINKTNFGGDIVDIECDINTDEGHRTMEYLFEWRKMLEDIPNHHSIVGNHDDGNKTNHLFPDEYIYSFLLEPEECDNIVKGNGFYYYIDSENEKTRYIYLDSAYEGVTQDQLLFLEGALLSTPENYHIVVFSHVWYDPDYDNYHIRPIPIIGFNQNSLQILTLLDCYNMRHGKFSDCKGYVEFCLGGHAHIDHSGYSNSGIPVIITEADCINHRGIYDSTLKTTNESSINAIITDYNKRQINIIRIGRGENKLIEY